jgi:NAD(P)-dependent dehydrogenase (short-subunit alcohol dehydrogenase family)
LIDFKGQVAIVTGAGRGLGRLYALELARRGAKVIVNDLGGTTCGESSDSSVADQVVKEIKSAGGDALSSHDSVATPEGGKAIVQAALDGFGRVDIVVSNAGIYQVTPFADLSVEEWRRMLTIHLDGSFYVSQPAFRAMQAQGYGRFVFISSSAGMFGIPGNAHYAAAKSGIFGLTNIIALEGAAHGIKANAVLPTGFSRMVTESTGAAEPGSSPFYQAIKPELVVPLVIFLASRACEFSHHNYAACAGRYSRVFVGLGEGWASKPGSLPTADDLLAHVDDISRTDPYIVPGSTRDEINHALIPLGVGRRS